MCQSQRTDKAPNDCFLAMLFHASMFSLPVAICQVRHKKAGMTTM
jgi:hypothetical protein